MKKLTITAIGTAKDVNTKYGAKKKNYIKAAEYGDNYLSFWVAAGNANWKVGDTIEVEDVATREYEGKTYYDIILPKSPMGNTRTEYLALHSEMKLMQTQMSQIGKRQGEIYDMVAQLLKLAKGDEEESPVNMDVDF